MYPGDNCTNYVAFVESTVYGVSTPTYDLGNGYTWASAAANNGVLVNHTPTVGSVAYCCLLYTSLLKMRRISPSTAPTVIARWDAITLVTTVAPVVACSRRRRDMASRINCAQSLSLIHI